MLLPAPGTVDIVVPRLVGIDRSTYLARSTDGGRTFGPAVRIADGAFEHGAPVPDGRIALVGGPSVLGAHAVPADGSAGGTSGASLGEILDGLYNDAAAQGGDVVVASSYRIYTQSYRLPAGGDPNAASAWQRLPDMPGGQPELAAGPAGVVAMLEPSGRSPSGLFVRRLEGATWSPPVVVLPTGNGDFDLAQNARGRLSALATTSPPMGHRLTYTTSTDGGVLWSSTVGVAEYGDRSPAALEFATATDGRGVAVVDSSTTDHAVRGARFSPRSAPTALRRFGSTRVQVRSVCDRDELSVVVEAARGTRRVSPATVLRRATFGRARGAQRSFAGRFRARYEVRRRARVRVRLTPRRGRGRPVTLLVRRCGLL